jgi:hypothetical protein
MRRKMSSATVFRLFVSVASPHASSPSESTARNSSRIFVMSFVRATFPFLSRQPTFRGEEFFPARKEPCVAGPPGTGDPGFEPGTSPLSERRPAIVKGEALSAMRAWVSGHLCEPVARNHSTSRYSEPRGSRERPEPIRFRCRPRRSHANVLVLPACAHSRQPLQRAYTKHATCRPFRVGRAGIEPATLGLRVPCSTS